MATGNFYNTNASKIFAVEIEDEWEYDNLFTNLCDALRSTDYHAYTTLGAAPCENDYNRSFPGKILGGKGVSKMYGDCEVFIHITPVIRSGYYSGVNLDWEIESEAGSLDPEQYELEKIFRMDYGINAGMAKIQARNAEYWLEHHPRGIRLAGTISKTCRICSKKSIRRRALPLKSTRTMALCLRTSKRLRLSLPNNVS